MKKTDLLAYLDEKMQKLDFDGNLSLNWDKKQHTFTIGMEFFVENHSIREIIDAENVKSLEPVINFYDEILLYDQTVNLKAESENYLVCLSFDGKKGWTQGKADAFLAVLQKTLDDGESDLLDFVNDENQEVFELKWDSNEFQQKQSDFSSETDRLKYPKF